MTIVKVRQSQTVGTYGPGSLVDFPDNAVLIAGLDYWRIRGARQSIPEPRLIANLRNRFQLSTLELYAPPVPVRDDDDGVGITAWEFPTWYLAQFEKVAAGVGRSRPLLPERALTRGRYVNPDYRTKRGLRDYPVVPVRFVQACANGHVSDIDWFGLLHEGGVPCPGSLWFDETGTTGDLSDLWLRCDGCNKSVGLKQLRDDSSRLGVCMGDAPWKAPGRREPCIGPDGNPLVNKLLIRHASNAYFPVIERAISIPDQFEIVRKAVDHVWSKYLSAVQELPELRYEMRKPDVRDALVGLSESEIWDECQRRHSGTDVPVMSLKEFEVAAFLSAKDSLGHDKPEGDFYARNHPLPEPRDPRVAPVNKVVLVHRLREVVAQVGFTRFEVARPPIESELDLNVGLAQLADEVKWLPAVENRGEGIFISLDEARVKEWLKRKPVQSRGEAFRPAIERTFKRQLNPNEMRDFYIPYLLLHSLSHLLLTAISLECGYSATSLHERIYVRGGYGILLYTSASDAEGTLGGLVHVGRKIDRHLLAALEMGRLCSNDPVCAQQHPAIEQANRDSHGAACHGCLLIAEPCCERGNDLLDRSFVVPTVHASDVAFFDTL